MARSHSRGSEQTNDRLDNCSRLAYAPLSCRSDMGRLGQCIASRTAAGFHTLLHTLQKVSAVGQCFSPLGLTREVHITWITHEVFLCITLVHIWKKAKFCSEAQCSKILESDFFFSWRLLASTHGFLIPNHKACVQWNFVCQAHLPERKSCHSR